MTYILIIAWYCL